MRDEERPGCERRRWRRKAAAVVVCSLDLVCCGLAEITAEPERHRQIYRWIISPLPSSFLTSLYVLKAPFKPGDLA